MKCVRFSSAFQVVLILMCIKVLNTEHLVWKYVNWAFLWNALLAQDMISQLVSSSMSVSQAHRLFVGRSFFLNSLLSCVLTYESDLVRQKDSSISSNTDAWHPDCGNEAVTATGEGCEEIKAC